MEKEKIESQTHFSKKKHAEICKNGKNNLWQILEGARKYVGSDIREGTCCPGKLVRNKLL